MRRLTTDIGAAVLMVTHNLGVVREFAEYVYVMYAGTIVEHGPVDELLELPRHPYTAALLAAGTTLGWPQPAAADCRHCAEFSLAAAWLPLPATLPACAPCL